MPKVRPFTGRRIVAGRVGGAYKPPAAGASGPAFRSISQGDSASGSFTMAVPTGTASGDQLLMFVAIEADFDGYSVGTPSAGWTLISSDDTYHPTYPSDSWRVYKRTAGSSESTYSWSGGSAWYAGIGFVVAVSGATAVDVVGAGAHSLVAPTVTTTTSTDLLVYAVASAGSAPSITKPTAMTERANATPTPASFRVVIATQTLTATGATGTRTAIDGADSGFTSLLIAIK